MTRMIVTVVGAYVLTLILGRVLLPVLRALKAGQSINTVFAVDEDQNAYQILVSGYENPVWLLGQLRKAVTSLGGDI